MRVLIADKFEASGVNGLKDLGAEVFLEPDLKEDALAARIKELEPEVLVVRSTKVNDSMMVGKLGLIIRAGAGYNTIDVDAASGKGILVTNCPGKNSHAVAELAFGLIVAADRHIANCTVELREGKWNKKAYSNARGLYGRTLGLIGMGKISQEMVTIAKALGMNVVAHSRWMTPDVAAALGIGRASSVEELAFLSDVISCHVALTKDTRGMLGASFFEKVRPGTIFVNTSRAEVVDQAAMLKAIEEKGIRVGLDVFEGEPATATGDYDGPLKNVKNAVVTHHVGASTEEAQEAVAAEVVRIVKEYKLQGTAPNVVNVKRAEVATHLLVVRHLDKVGVLAHVLSALRDESVNVQEMENIVLGGATAAIAQISVDKAPSEQCLLNIKRHEAVFDASVFPIEK